MQVGELFLNIGVKGADKTVSSLNDVKKSLGEAKSMSLEMKAALVAAFYAIEKLMAASGRMGTNLTNFGATTGANIKTLQQWQYAAQQAGVSGDEMANSFKAVQDAMTKMSLGGAPPEGMARMVNAVGDFDRNKINDTFYVLQKLQEARQKLGPQVGGQVLKSFGVGEGVNAAMARNVFNQENFNKAPSYSGKEVASLDKTNVGFKNIGQEIEMAFGHFTAKHGPETIKSIENIVAALAKLLDILEVLGEKFKIFSALGHLADASAAVVNLVTTGLGDVAGTHKQSDNAKNFGKDSAITKILNYRDEMDAKFLSSLPFGKGASAAGGTKAATVNQTNNFHGVKDHKDLAHHVGKELKHAVKTNPAIIGGQ